MGGSRCSEKKEKEERVGGEGVQRWHALFRGKRDERRRPRSAPARRVIEQLARGREIFPSPASILAPRAAPRISPLRRRALGVIVAVVVPGSINTADALPR